MALKTVGKKEYGPVRYVKPNTDLKEGESFSGYFTGIKENPENGALTMYLQPKDGSETLGVSAHGNIKWRLTDNDLQPGLFTVITSLGPVMKKGKKTAEYQIQQDDEDSIEVSSGTFVTTGANPSKESTERANIKARAEQLKQAASK